MEGVDGWDMALLVAAGYVAVVTLVRLMSGRRDRLLGELRKEADKEKSRQETEGAPRPRSRRGQAA